MRNFFLQSMHETCVELALHDKVYGDSKLVLLARSCHKYYNKIASTETLWVKKM